MTDSPRQSFSVEQSRAMVHLAEAELDNIQQGGADLNNHRVTSRTVVYALLNMMWDSTLAALGEAGYVILKRDATAFMFERDWVGRAVFADCVGAMWGAGENLPEAFEDWLVSARDLHARLATAELHPDLVVRKEFLDLAFGVKPDA